jgi:hypothetical protein
MEFQPAADELKKRLTALQREKRSRRRGSRSLRRLASEIDRVISGPPPR